LTRIEIFPWLTHQKLDYPEDFWCNFKNWGGEGAIASIAPPWPRACARIEFFFPLPHTSTVNPTSRNLRNRAFSNQPKTHATCFIAGRNLSSGSFQSQQDVLKNTVK